jgi:hypothetical protein
MIQSPNLNPSILVPVYAVLLIDGCRLLIPQKEIAILELISDMQREVSINKKQNSVGYLPFQGESWPVFCLTGQLTISEEIPKTRQVCALLNDNNNNYLALLCDSIQNIERQHLLVQTIPACMRQVDMLISALAIYKEELLYITTISQLSEFLENYRPWNYS